MGFERAPDSYLYPPIPGVKGGVLPIGMPPFPFKTDFTFMAPMRRSVVADTRREGVNLTLKSSLDQVTNQG